MKTGARFLLARGGLALQLILILAAWVYLCRLHWNNDGLFYQGDAPRHAANGLFWKDFLQNPSLHPQEYALSYYARYPAVNPAAYPPFFYILEAAVFAALGPSPYAAKGLVLLFALMATIYTAAWLRRWLGQEAGWAAALLLLLPGVAYWSHAIMLNVPAFALGLAGLYHARRWLESPAATPDWKQLYAGAAFSVLAILTHFTLGVVVLIGLGWLIFLRRWRLLLSRRTILVAAICAALLLPWLLLTLRWAPATAVWAAPGAPKILRLSTWTYYPDHWDELFSLHLIVLAAAGIIGGLLSRRWRQESLILLIWAGVAYVFFSYLEAKESRYVLLLSTPLVCSCVIGLTLIARGIGRLVGGLEKTVTPILLAGLSVLFAVQAWQVSRERVPSVRGFRDLVAFIEEVAPAEPVLYDGGYHGVFIFYLQAGDPEYRRRVVLGSQLLYAVAPYPQEIRRQFVSSPREVVETLQKRGGCRWILVGSSHRSETIAAARHLREAVKGPEFELERSFPIFGAEIVRVDVYRLLLPVQEQEEADLPVPTLGPDIHYRVKPIPPRGGAGSQAP